MADSTLELHAAVCCNDSEALEHLLESGSFAVNEKDTEWGYKTALHWAAQKGFVDCAKLLIDYGAKGNVRSLYGSTPAHCAAETGKIMILKLFAKSKISVSRSDDFGDKPIDKARIYGHQQVEQETTVRRRLRSEKMLAERQVKLKPSVKSKTPRLTQKQIGQIIREIEEINAGTFEELVSDPDIDDDPVPHSDEAYLTWLLEKEPRKERVASATNNQRPNSRLKSTSGTSQIEKQNSVLIPNMTI